jgi:hypothetical protein
LTDAPGTTAPFSSLTTPVSVPVLDVCASTALAGRNNAKSNINSHLFCRRVLVALLVFITNLLFCFVVFWETIKLAGIDLSAGSR